MYKCYSCNTLYYELSLQSVARSLCVYGARFMDDVGVVKCFLKTVLPGVEHLNHWRMRVLLHILCFTVYRYACTIGLVPQAVSLVSVVTSSMEIRIY